MTRLLDRILNDARAKYGSFESPHFGFATEVYARHPYLQLFQRLRQSWTIRDVTDLNEDHSFVYELESSGATWVLQVSFLGPYAVLLRSNGRLVISEDADAVESQALNTLEAEGLILVPKSVLEIPLPLRLHYTEPENVCVYHALFSDVDRLPWKDA